VANYELVTRSADLVGGLEKKKKIGTHDTILTDDSLGSKDDRAWVLRRGTKNDPGGEEKRRVGRKLLLGEAAIT